MLNAPASNLQIALQCTVLMYAHKLRISLDKYKQRHVLILVMKLYRPMQIMIHVLVSRPVQLKHMLII